MNQLQHLFIILTRMSILYSWTLKFTQHLVQIQHLIVKFTAVFDLLTC